MPGLAEHHRAIAFDLKGYGESDKPEGGYDLGTLCREMRDAVRALGYERASWVGHDWGGLILWGLALCYPEVVDRFVVVNAAFHRLSLLHAWHILPLSLPGVTPWVLERAGALLMPLMWRYAYNRRALTLEDIVEYAIELNRPGVARASTAYYRSLWRSALQLRLWLPRKVARPCMILWGAHDPALPVSLLRGIERHFTVPPRIELLPRTGHWVVEEQPERSLALMREFLG